MKTTVVNINRNETFDVYIGRAGRGHGGKWGNPFRSGNRQKDVDDFRTWIIRQPRLMADLEELRGKRLGCFCKPNVCHGDVLVELLGDDGWKQPEEDDVETINCTDGYTLDDEGMKVCEYGGKPRRAVLVTGDRDAQPLDWMKHVDAYCANFDVIIEGDARGIDRMAATVARKHKKELLVFPANWDRYGRSAGPRRNEQMLAKLRFLEREGCEIEVIAFHPDIRNSKGTYHMAKIAWQTGVPVTIVDRNGESSKFVRAPRGEAAPTQPSIQQTALPGLEDHWGPRTQDEDIEERKMNLSDQWGNEAPDYTPIPNEDVTYVDMAQEVAYA